MIVHHENFIIPISIADISVVVSLSAFPSQIQSENLSILENIQVQSGHLSVLGIVCLSILDTIEFPLDPSHVFSTEILN